MDALTSEPIVVPRASGPALTPDEAIAGEAFTLLDAGFLGRFDRSTDEAPYGFEPAPEPPRPQKEEPERRQEREPFKLDQERPEMGAGYAGGLAVSFDPVTDPFILAVR